MNGYMKSSLKIYFSTPEIDFSLVFVCEIILVSRIMLVIVIENCLGLKWVGACACSPALNFVAWENKNQLSRKLKLLLS